MASRIFPSIGLKVFGIASTMVAMLLAVAYLSYTRIRQVNHELTDIALYLTPLTEDLATINVHALEQDIHLERLIRHFQAEPIPWDTIQAEQRQFVTRSRQIDLEIAAALALADTAAERAYIPADILKIARLRPLLEVLQTDHQRLHEHSLALVQRYEAGDTVAATVLAAQLAELEDDFDARLQGMVVELATFVESAAATAAAHEQRTLQLSWWLAALAGAVGLGFAALVTLGLVRPVRRLVRQSAAVAAGDLAADLPVSSADEVGRLTDSFNVLVADLRTKARLKTTFGQYVDPRIVDTLLAQSTAPGQHQRMTVFCSDIARFSHLGELLTPTGLVALINRYLTLASVPIHDHGGVINQFVGDGVSAFWGPPFVPADRHALLACRAALEQFDQLVKLQRELPELLGLRKGLPSVTIRIGLASGDVVAGTIGSERAKSYTVLGPAVQRAEALEVTNKTYGTRILLDAPTRDLAGEAIEVREIDRLALPGLDPAPVYELLGLVGSTPAPLLTLRDQFQTGLAAYRQGQWTEAEAAWEHCLALVPQDGPSRYYQQRVRATLGVSPEPA